MAEERVVTRQTSTQDQTAFIQSVKASLTSAREKVARIRRTNTQLFIVNVVSPAAATLITALAAILGGNNLFRQAAVQMEDGGWIFACGLAAVFGFLATVSGVFKKQFDDQLALGNQCIGRLLALDLGIASGSTRWEEAAREYGEVIRTFPEFVG